MAMTSDGCSKTILAYRCILGASVERDGKWYCDGHDPVAIAERKKRDKEERDVYLEWEQRKGNACALKKMPVDQLHAELNRRGVPFGISMWLMFRLHYLQTTGDGDGAEADEIRDEMEGPWFEMSAAEKALVNDLSATLQDLAPIQK